MVTDRLYLVAGSLAPRLNESLPESATLLDTNLDVERECVHATVAIASVGGYSLYFEIDERTIESALEQRDKVIAPRKTFRVTEFMSDSTWAQLVVDYITSEVNHFIAMNTPRPTVNDLAKSKAESEQGYSLA